MSLRDRIKTYTLRDAEDHELHYAEGIRTREEAEARARELADFYGKPVEVVEVLAGRVELPGVDDVEPGPTAPPPLTA